jgi:hypothetical protein
MSGPYANTLAALASGDATGLAATTNVTQEIGKWSNGSYTDLTKQADSTAKQARAAIASVATTPAAAPPSQAADVGKLRSLDLSAGIQPGAVPSSVAPTTPASIQPASAQTVNPADVNPGQQVTNPTDTYIPSVTSITTNPASADAAAYQTATTGPNRPAYLGNQYLNAYSAILSMIKAGGPTAR